MIACALLAASELIRSAEFTGMLAVPLSVWVLSVCIFLLICVCFMHLSMDVYRQEWKYYLCKREING